MKLQGALTLAKQNPDEIRHIENIELFRLYRAAAVPVPDDVLHEEESASMSIAGRELLELERQKQIMSRRRAFHIVY